MGEITAGLLGNSIWTDSGMVVIYMFGFTLVMAIVYTAFAARLNRKQAAERHAFCREFSFSPTAALEQETALMTMDTRAASGMDVPPRPALMLSEVATGSIAGFQSYVCTSMFFFGRPPGKPHMGDSTAFVVQTKDPTLPAFTLRPPREFDDLQAHYVLQPPNSPAKAYSVFGPDTAAVTAFITGPAAAAIAGQANLEVVGLQGNLVFFRNCRLDHSGLSELRASAELFVQSLSNDPAH